MRIAICDDDVNVLNCMREMLFSFAFIHNIDMEIRCYEDGERLLHEMNEFELIVLDIEMPQMDGIRVAKRIRTENRQCKIVYISSHTEYVMQSFVVHPFDFLVKPITKERIDAIMADYLDYLDNTIDLEDKKIEFQGEKSRIYLSVNSIYYFEYASNRRIIAHSEKASYVIKGSLQNIMNKLAGENCFAVPHKGFVVNMKYIEKINGYTIFLTNGSSLPVAQKKYKKFCDIFGSYIGAQVLKK